MISDEITQWLSEQPLDKPTDIDGEEVYLRVHNKGAELGLYLVRDYTPEQLQQVLKQGFNSALKYSAGLGVSPDNQALVLSQWLPGVASWVEVAQPLEELLNQAEMLRTGLKTVKDSSSNLAADRNERRLRNAFAGARS